MSEIRKRNVKSPESPVVVQVEKVSQVDSKANLFYQKNNKAKPEPGKVDAKIDYTLFKGWRS